MKKPHLTKKDLEQIYIIADKEFCSLYALFKGEYTEETEKHFLEYLEEVKERFLLRKIEIAKEKYKEKVRKQKEIWDNMERLFKK